MDEKKMKEKDEVIKVKLKVFSIRALGFVIILSAIFYFVPERITIAIIAGIVLLSLWDNIDRSAYK